LVGDAGGGFERRAANWRKVAGGGERADSGPRRSVPRRSGPHRSGPRRCLPCRPWSCRSSRGHLRIPRFAPSPVQVNCSRARRGGIYRRPTSRATTVGRRGRQGGPAV